MFSCVLSENQTIAFVRLNDVRFEVLTVVVMGYNAHRALHLKV
jgi:hypothetical protein